MGSFGERTFVKSFWLTHSSARTSVWVCFKLFEIYSWLSDGDLCCDVYLIIWDYPSLLLCRGRRGLTSVHGLPHVHCVRNSVPCSIQDVGLGSLLTSVMAVFFRIWNSAMSNKCLGPNVAFLDDLDWISFSLCTFFSIFSISAKLNMLILDFYILNIGMVSKIPAGWVLV